MEQIESKKAEYICPLCKRKVGITLTCIPNYNDVILSKFWCKHCGVRTSIKYELIKKLTGYKLKVIRFECEKKKYNPKIRIVENEETI